MYVNSVKARVVIDLQLYMTYLTFLRRFAGYETTAGALGFSLFALAHDASLQARLREELDDFQRNTGREPTYDDFNSRLPLMDAVCKEVCVRSLLCRTSRNRSLTEEDGLHAG